MEKKLTKEEIKQLDTELILALKNKCKCKIEAIFGIRAMLKGHIKEKIQLLEFIQHEESLDEQKALGEAVHLYETNPQVIAERKVNAESYERRREEENKPLHVKVDQCRIAKQRENYFEVMLVHEMKEDPDIIVETGGIHTYDNWNALKKVTEYTSFSMWSGCSEREKRDFYKNSKEITKAEFQEVEDIIDDCLERVQKVITNIEERKDYEPHVGDCYVCEYPRRKWLSKITDIKGNKFLADDITINDNSSDLTLYVNHVEYLDLNLFEAYKRNSNCRFVKGNPFDEILNIYKEYSSKAKEKMLLLLEE